jgi:hypothetical protein
MKALQMYMSLTTDIVVCSWPWQWFVMGRDDCPLLLTSDQCIPVKNTYGRSAVMFYACEILQSCPVVFYVVTAVHKFDFRFVANKTPNKWWPVERRSCSDSNSCFWQDLHVFPQPSSQFLRDCTYTVKVKCIPLGKGQYLPMDTLQYPRRLESSATLLWGL